MNQNASTSFADDEIEVQTTRKTAVIAAAKVAAYVLVPVALTLATNVVLEKMKKS